MTVGEVLADARILGNHLLAKTPFDTSPTAETTARIVTAVSAVLSCSNIEDAADRIRETDQIAAKRAGALRIGQPPHWNAASRRLKLALGRSRSAKVQPLDRLRLPSALSLGLPRSTILDRYLKTPGQLWPSWTLRLMPPDGFALLTYPSTGGRSLPRSGRARVRSRRRASTDAGSVAVGCARSVEQPRLHEGLDVVHCGCRVLTSVALSEELDGHLVQVESERQPSRAARRHDESVAARRPVEAPRHVSGSRSCSTTMPASHCS